MAGMWKYKNAFCMLCRVYIFFRDFQCSFKRRNSKMLDQAVIFAQPLADNKITLSDSDYLALPLCVDLARDTYGPPV
jgi:hypothetical protein